MSILLATGLVGFSAWLWLTPWDPGERLAKIPMFRMRLNAEARPGQHGRDRRAMVHAGARPPYEPARAGHSHATPVYRGRGGSERLGGLAHTGGGERWGGVDRPAGVKQLSAVERLDGINGVSGVFASGGASGLRGRFARYGLGAYTFRKALPSILVAIGGIALVGGVPGVVCGVGAGVLTLVIGHRAEPREARRRRARITADLPFAVDLMVACLRAGRPVSAAVQTAANAIGGPLGERLAWVNGQLRLGARPEDAWSALEKDRPLAAMARGMVRAALSGAPVADVLSRLADDARQDARAASSAAARRVGVQAVAPLGLCFLPAFVLVGVIPVVAGLAGQVFGR
ncbi:type II secretion system F family protein [Sphaerisporangium sp. NPDC005288]|uniref:type II secretion system F family protein n=1 Tax=Sphaerisporangium sp. NPDC005288 TaxID=3155114 RepID=UPI0033B56B54